MLRNDSQLAHSQLTVKPPEPSDYMKRSGLVRMLHGLSGLIPGEYLKTAVYLNCVDRPRRMLRDALFSFYRYDHVYSVLREFAGHWAGKFSVLEFGTSDGYSFVKLLYATRYLKLEDRVLVHTFDSFEGMPATADQRDKDWAGGNDWAEGQFRGNYEALQDYCSKRYRNFTINRGLFENSVDAPFVESLAEHPPVLIWIDCDYYSSAKTILTRLIDRIPNGCVIYFDDLDNLNFGSRLTGEARLVYEINLGLLGENVELVPDHRLSLQSRRIYRFMKVPPNKVLLEGDAPHTPDQVRRRSNGSPMP
jgi:hypothetical protein